ncbi:Hpt domain-containing protein [Pseudomonas sp. gcc21]|uniref:Hpt domain-containing protein n=1 Tax=Pseudomonas sp. gcc21 TaxID=2726989 RepID=UPI001451B2DD|nr:Hpt domain-containing protein [Pseudomonas sp. gcc21]QJD58830.1 Hpt domain-containing protein [Pseudomonas sp. gcc21]
MSEPLDLEPSVQASLRELMLDEYEVLLETFITDTEMRLGLLRSHLLTENWRAYRQTAHSLRGSCGNIGALALHGAAAEAERAGAAADRQAATAAFERLLHLYDRVKPQLSLIIFK